MKKVVAFMADGTEETECLAVADILKRGGVNVVTVSVSEAREIVSSHGIRIGTDATIADAEADIAGADLLFLPGGMPGTRKLAACQPLCRALEQAAKAGKRLAAICAAPSVLGGLGLLRGKRATCFPGFESELLGATVCPDGIVTDGNITTARGLGFALDLGLELLAQLVDRAASDKVKSAVQYKF